MAPSQCLTCGGELPPRFIPAPLKGPGLPAHLRPPPESKCICVPIGGVTQSAESMERKTVYQRSREADR
jgi:hypothetical protein